MKKPMKTSREEKASALDVKILDQAAPNVTALLPKSWRQWLRWESWVMLII